MVEIFFSIVSDFCIILLFENEVLVSTLKENDYRSHSENFVTRINNMLLENKLSFDKIEKIYFVSGHGQQTGIRVSESFVSAMKILSKNIRVFSIESIFFQKGSLRNCLSILSFGNRTKNYWYGLYENDTLISLDKTDDFKIIEKLSFSKKTKTVIDFEQTNFLENFLFLKNFFCEQDF